MSSKYSETPSEYFNSSIDKHMKNDYNPFPFSCQNKLTLKEKLER